MYTEITFKGTAIKLGTCYRNIAAELGTANSAKVTIDGTEYPCIEGALVPGQANDTTVTIFFEASGLEDKEHTVRVYNAEKNFKGTRLTFDFYEIIGTDPGDRRRLRQDREHHRAGKDRAPRYRKAR